jgi:hypothetical protein
VVKRTIAEGEKLRQLWIVAGQISGSCRQACCRPPYCHKLTNQASSQGFPTLLLGRPLVCATNHTALIPGALGCAFSLSLALALQTNDPQQILTTEAEKKTPGLKLAVILCLQRISFATVPMKMAGWSGLNSALADRVGKGL